MAEATVFQQFYVIIPVFISNVKLFWYCKAPCLWSLTLSWGLLNISGSSKEAIRQKGLHFMVFRCMTEARWRILRRTWEVRERKGQEGLRRVRFAFPSVRTRMTPASGNKCFEINLFAAAFLPVLLRRSQSSREPWAFSERKWVKLSNAQKKYITPEFLFCGHVTLLCWDRIFWNSLCSCTTDQTSWKLRKTAAHSSVSFYIMAPLSCTTTGSAHCRGGVPLPADSASLFHSVLKRMALLTNHRHTHTHTLRVQVLETMCHCFPCSSDSVQPISAQFSHTISGHTVW